MLGGAEKSSFEILKKEMNKGREIELISFADVDTFGAQSKKNDIPLSWKIKFIYKIFTFKKFFYWEYVFNRLKLKKYFNSLDEQNVLYTYAIYAPIAINSFKGKSKLFIRSETDLAINKNYHNGLKKFLKYLYLVLEYPAYYIYKNDLKKAIKKADIICNSKYMSKKLKELYGKNSKVLYPFVDERRLIKEFNSVKDEVYSKGVVFVGDALIKGINIAKDLSTQLPNVKFYFFSRYISEKKVENNIIWMPWQNKEVDIYKYASFVIVPSIWEEAYGRVSREAYILGIPVFVSNIGGLPESVDYKKEFIVDNYLNIKNWKEKIESNI